MRSLLLLICIIAAVCVGSATATSSPQQLPVANLQNPNGYPSRLSAGVPYEAKSQFPIALRLTPPDGSWSGAQWKTARLTSGRGGAPYYGWAAVQQGSPKLPPQGIVVIMTAYAATPSVAATVAGLRTRGHGATYQATSAVKVGGFSGIQFDGQVQTRHIFVPFSPPSNGGGAYPGKADAYEVAHNQPAGTFRVIVVNVRGKTVVIYLDSAALPADKVSAFLTKAEQLLKALRLAG
jgi:hypothetical protein